MIQVTYIEMDMAMDGYNIVIDVPPEELKELIHSAEDIVYGDLHGSSFKIKAFIPGTLVNRVS